MWCATSRTSLDAQPLRGVEPGVALRIRQIAEQQIEPVGGRPVDRAVRAPAEPGLVGEPRHVRLHMRVLLCAIGCRQRLGAERVTAQSLEESLDQRVRVGVGERGDAVEGGEQVGVRGRGAHPHVQAARGQRPDGGEVLGESEGRLEAQRHHVGLEGDARGALGCRGQHGQCRGDAALEMTLPHPHGVEAEPLDTFDQAQHALEPAHGVIRRVGARSDHPGDGDDAFDALAHCCLSSGAVNASPGGASHWRGAGGSLIVVDQAS